ncbi:hypothetical protein ABZY03_15615 [Streptomyces klenkii]
MICTATEAPAAPAVRPRHYPSDTTDSEWAVLEPLLPPAAINGRERHLAAANRDDHPARDLLFRLRLVHPEVTVAVPRRKDQEGFAVLAKRWRVERATS